MICGLQGKRNKNQISEPAELLIAPANRIKIVKFSVD